MFPYPNFEVYHQMIASYLDIVETRVKGRLLGSPGEASFFLTEMLYRGLTKNFQRQGLLGPGDLTDIDVDPIEDFNAGNVAFGGQKTLLARRFSSVSEVWEIKRFFEKYLEKIEFDTHGDDYAWQVIQEQAGLILLNLYFRKRAFVARSGKLIFHSPDIEMWLRPAYWDPITPEDWKSMRCLFYRYLMYCGFVQVNEENCMIIKESIPPLKLLARLAARLLYLTNMKEVWEKTDGLIDKCEEDLNPTNIAKHFLYFNEVKVEEGVA